MLECGMRKSDRLSTPEIEAARLGRLTATRLQEIESNPLSADQIAMFEMFEREGWTHERRRAHIFAQIRTLAAE